MRTKGSRSPVREDDLELRLKSLRRRHRTAAIVVPTLHRLRRWLAEADPAAMTSPVVRLELTIRRWRPPTKEWSGRLGNLPGVRGQRLSFPGRRGTGPARLALELAAPRELRAVLLAVLPLFGPEAAQVGTLRPSVGPYGGVAGEHGTGDAEGNISGNGSGNVDGHGKAGPDHDLPSSAVTIDPLAFEASVVNPVGRETTYGAYASGAEVPRLVVTPEAWHILDADDRVVLRGRTTQPGLDETQLTIARTLDAVRCVPGDSEGTRRRMNDDGVDPARDATAVGRLVTQLAAAGTAVAWPEAPAQVTHLLGPELGRLVRAPLPERGAEPLDWELRSVRQRRAALRTHARPFTLERALAAAAPGMIAEPSVSAVLVTRRFDRLPAALERFARQTYPNLEVVVGLHGEPPETLDVERLRADYPRPLTVLRFPTEWVFGTVLAAVTARCSGSLVTKVDDDDFYGPDHVWDLVLARAYSGADLVGKAPEFTYLRPLDVTVRRAYSPAEKYTGWVAGGTIMLARGDLEEVGGWRPVPRAVDRLLLERVREAGGVVYATHPFGFILERSESGHTWDTTLDYFLRRAGTQWPGLLRHEDVGREFGTDDIPVSVPVV